MLISCFSNTAFNKGQPLFMIGWIHRDCVFSICSQKYIYRCNETAGNVSTRTPLHVAHRLNPTAAAMHVAFSFRLTSVWWPSWQPKSCPGARRHPMICCVSADYVHRNVTGRRQPSKARVWGHHQRNSPMPSQDVLTVLNWGTRRLIFVRLHAVIALNNPIFVESRGIVLLSIRKR